MNLETWANPHAGLIQKIVKNKILTIFLSG